MAMLPARAIAPVVETVNFLMLLSAPPEAQTVYGPLPVICSPMKYFPAVLICDTTVMVRASITETE